MQPRSARITGWGAYAPEMVVTNHDLERLVETSDEWIVTRTGIRERRIAAPGESTATLAANAGARALAVAGLDPADVGLVLVATCTPDYQMPSTAALVREALGTTNAAAMDLAAVCSGFVYAYSAGHAYVASGMYRHVVVIGAEVMSRILDYTDRNTCVLFGDGAGAVVLSACDEPGGGLLGFELTTDPDGAYRIFVPAGGTRSPATGSTLDRRGHFMRMDGRETYRYATRTLASSAMTAISRAGLTIDDVDLVVPHQANIRIIESVAKQIGLPLEKVFVNLDRYGNTSAASVPLALAEAVEAGRVHVGSRIVFVAFGSGYTSGAAVIEWTADPALAARARDARPNPIHQPTDWSHDDPTPPELRPLFQPGGVVAPLRAVRSQSSSPPTGIPVVAAGPAESFATPTSDRVPATREVTA